MEHFFPHFSNSYFRFDWAHENTMINLLEYNPTNHRVFKNANRQDIERFKNKLENYGLEVKIRVSHGRNIKAACGQLANKYNRVVEKPQVSKQLPLKNAVW